MRWPRSQQAGLIQQALVPLAIGTAAVAMVMSVLVYHRASVEQREEVLRDIRDSTRIRQGHEQSLFDRSAQQLRWCQSTLRLRPHGPGPELPGPGIDGCRRRVAPGEAEGVSIFTAPHLDQGHLATVQTAAQVIRELGHAEKHLAANIMVVAPGRWMVGWGPQPAALAADMLPDDPILLPVERSLLEGRGEVRWTHAFLEPVTDRWLVAAGITAQLPDTGPVVILQVIPAEDILVRIAADQDSTRDLTAVFDGQQRILTTSLGRGSEHEGRGETTLRSSGVPRLDRIATVIPAQGEAVEVIADPDGSGWYAVGRLHGPNWTMVTFHEAAQVAAHARSLVGDTLLLCLLFFLGQGVLVVAVLRWRVQGPLAQLTNAVTDLEAGKRTVTLDLRRNDEVGHLAQAFVRMTQAVTQREAELITARQAAERSDQAKTEFLGMMSHELRTPMNGIMGMTELLLESRLDAEQQDLASTTLTCAKSLLGIINDILDYSRLDAERMELETTAFDLHALVHDVTELLSVKASDQGVLVLVDWAEELPAHVIGDPNRLRQILVNLVGNAVKFTHRGHIVVEVRRQDGITRICVQDTGIGIPTTRLRDIFDPFIQADATMSRRYGGSGLGLAICRRLARLMSGFVSVDSTEGQGSRFTVSIPLPVPEGQMVPTSTACADQRILILDRDPVSAHILANLVKRLGGTCRIAVTWSDLEEALAEADQEENPYHVLCLDHTLAPTWSPSAASTLPTLVTLGARGLRAPGRLLGKEPRGHLARPVRSADLEAVMVRIRESRTAGSGEDSRVDPGWKLHGHVLVVEDSPVHQRLALLILDHLGVTCDTATDGGAAVELVRIHRYDAILMDCIMPVMDGYTATAEIRRLGHQGSLPIIAMTTSSDAADRDRCHQAGMDDFLAKPFFAEQLAVVLRRWLRHRPSLPEASSP